MIVTSFSKAGYEQYGRRFLESYRKHCNLPLVIYTEDPIDIETEPLWGIPGCATFVDIVSRETTRPVTNGYRFNTSKFCRKVFVINHVASTFKGKFAWLDADTVLHKDIPDDFLDTLLEGVYLAYLGRDCLHSETGFIAFDTTHEMNFLFQLLFLREYTSGAYHDLKYWCDSDIFDHILTLLNPPANDLTTDRNSMNPFGESILGQYMTHYKGPNKC